MTLPAGKALGETSDPRELILGDPASVDTDAAALTDESRRISGLADDLEAIQTPGWEGGLGQPAYASAREATSAKWRAYAGLLEQAGSTLTGYAAALRTAQDRAREAIALWQQGEAATQQAVADYNAQVEAYNAYQQRCVAVPSYGGPSTPSIGPARPGPFVDPGQPMRDEAEQILADARTALDAAGAVAVKELGGLEGGRTEGSSGPYASGSVEGPSFDWGDWENTFGRDPSTGPDGRYDGGGPDSPWKINLGKVEGEARAWGAEGSWEDYWGDVRVQADGSVTVLGVDGSASAHIGADGLVAEANGRFTVVGAEGSVRGEWGVVEAQAAAEAYVGANAEGNLAIGPQGVHAGGELFAGAKAEGTLSGDIAGVGGELTGEAWAGWGVAGDVDFGMQDGKFTIGGSGGLAFGVGGKVGGEITLDFGEIAETGGDIVEGVGDFFGL